MCGIFGAVGFGKDLNHCLDQIVYRGPDDWGEYFCQAHQVYLAQRRLSIIDHDQLARFFE